MILSLPIVLLALVLNFKLTQATTTKQCKSNDLKSTGMTSHMVRECMCVFYKKHQSTVGHIYLIIFVALKSLRDCNVCHLSKTC